MDRPYILTNIKLRLNTHSDLTAATEPEVHYVKPDGTTGEWTATKNGEYIEYTLDDSDVDEAGTWKFQAACLFGGRVVKGDIVRLTFFNPIKTD